MALKFLNDGYFAGKVGIGTVSPAGLLEINGGTGVATSGGTLIVRQDGDANTDGIALTSSNAISHRIWKDVNGKLNIGPSTLPSALVQDLSGNVRIGTTSPAGKLEIQGSNPTIVIDVEAANENGTLYFRDAFGGGVARIQTAGQDITFRTGTTGDDDMVILSSGNVGIGTTSPNGKLEIASDSSLSSYITQYTNDTDGAELVIRTARGTESSPVRYNTNDSAGRILFQAYTSSGEFEDAASIESVLESGYSNSYAGLRFNYLPAVSPYTLTEGMRLNMYGNVGIGATSPGYKLAVYGSTSGSEIVASFGNGNASNEYTAIGLSGFIASNGATKAGLALKRTAIYGTGELHFLNNNTLDNSDITLSDSKMMINASGNVGIGTTGPGSKLELGPNGSLGANITNKNVILNIDGGYGTTGTPASGQYKVIGFTGTTKDVTDITGQTGGETSKNFYAGIIGGDYFNSNRFSVWQNGMKD